MSLPGDQPSAPRGLAQIKDLRDLMRDIVVEMLERGEPVGWVAPTGVISIARRRRRSWGYVVKQFVRMMVGAPRVEMPSDFAMFRRSILAEIAEAVAFLAPDEVGRFPFDEETEHADIFSMLLCDEPLARQANVVWIVLPKVTLPPAGTHGPSKWTVGYTANGEVFEFLPRRLVISSSVHPDVTIEMRIGTFVAEAPGTPVCMFSERALAMIKTYPALHNGIAVTLEVSNPTADPVEFTPVLLGLRQTADPRSPAENQFSTSGPIPDSSFNEVAAAVEALRRQPGTDPPEDVEERERRLLVEMGWMADVRRRD